MSLAALLKCGKLARSTPIYTVLIQHRAPFSSGIAVDVFSHTYLNKTIWAAEKTTYVDSTGQTAEVQLLF